MPVAVKTKPKTQQKATQANAQKQVEEQVGVGQQQSLLVLSTLLHASISCITFLRGILTDDNFEDNHIGGTTADHDSQGDGSKGLRIKSIKRGYSEEADKLLNMTEIGVMDALQNGYLKSVIFFIYIDPNEPENVIESYTVNVFDAASVDGMTLHITGTGSAASTALGTPVTVGEVKKAVKKIIRQLIVITQQYKELPQRRYIDVKLIYTPDTPQDYEPPHFTPCDDKLFFATHSPDEIPEKSSIGKLQTGHHGIAIKSTTIVEHLPFGNATDSQPFGSMQRVNSGACRKRKQSEDEALAEDAKKRTCIWDAEMLSHDRSDFEGDQPDLSADQQPMGIKINGVLQSPIKDIAGRHRERSAIMTPGGRVVIGFPAQASDLPFSPTQAMHTQNQTQPRARLTDLDKRSYLDQGHTRNQASLPKDTQTPAQTLPEDYTLGEPTFVSRGINTQALLDKQRDIGELVLDVEMMESSSTAVDPETDPMESLAAQASALNVETRGRAASGMHDEMNCACEDAIEDGLSVECEECHSWIHGACSGYLDDQWGTIPTPYICLTCQIKRKVALMDPRGQAAILHKLKRFVQLRRLLSNCWAMAKNGATVESNQIMKKLLASDDKTVDALIANLIKLGFIDVKASYKTKSKKSKQASRLVWVKNAARAADYDEYFRPSDAHEQELMREADRLVAEVKTPAPEQPAPAPASDELPAPVKAPRKYPKASRGLERVDASLLA